MAKPFISARWLLVGLLGLGLWLAPGATYGQSRELIDATNRSITLNGQGRYQEALPLAKKAVRLGEQEFGANHLFSGRLLNNLAEVYGGQGRYAEAKTLLERALAIIENALGLEHPEVARLLNNMATLF